MPIPSIFPPSPPPPYRDHPVQHGPPAPGIRVTRVKLLEDWYACKSAPACITSWFPRSHTDNYDAGELTANDSRRVVCRDPAGVIVWQLGSVQDDDTGEWYIPSGWYCTVWQPEDSLDGHWEPLQASESCPGSSGSGSSGSSGSGSSGSGSGSGSSGSGSGACADYSQLLKLLRVDSLPGRKNGTKQVLVVTADDCIDLMDISDCDEEA